MEIELGKPVWTTGGFGRAAALDDLGIESVGASLLRRLLPGVVETTPNAGYYSFYPYLVARWEDENKSIRRADFKLFYRRQEAAFALACELHGHRDPLTGVNGSSKAAGFLATDPVDVAAFAAPDSYMESAYGGYGLFYARVIADLRLTELGSPGQIDRVTPRGRSVVEAFAESFEATAYFTAYRDAEHVPIDVLRELGEAACLCNIPGRSDHEGLVDAFFGPQEDTDAWNLQRITRMRSLGLFLEFHEQRPANVPSDVGAWRRVLLSGEYPNGRSFDTSFAGQLAYWRAYQLREVMVMALTSLWSTALETLDELQPIEFAALAQVMADSADWEAANLARSDPTGAAVDRARATLSPASRLIEEAELLEKPRSTPTRSRIVRAYQLALAVAGSVVLEGSEFDELLDEGGQDRWSLAHHRRWMDSRSDATAGDTLRDLVLALYWQHTRVATSKLSPTDSRDPFNVGEDNGLASVVRPDDPFWTSGRFRVVNQLLWGLGALTDPSEGPQITTLGAELLERARNA